MKVIKQLIILSLSLIVVPTLAQPRGAIYLDNSKPISERVEDALSRMTLEEKVAMCHAQSKFSSAGVSRLGIPEVWASDGPHGIRAEVFWDEWNSAGWTNDSCTAFPALTCLASTWNPEMSALYGKSIGEEARYRNKNILLGPGVNIYRTPFNGRNFEYMGEDPFLASKMVVPYIQEVQKNGVAACVKHFALNNQEKFRDHINVNVSERALHEIYLPAFKAAVQEGKAWSIMGSYNKYKGEHCCHNQYLLNDILRKDWGFDGVVLSDWGGVHDTKQAIYNGLDLEFGSWTNGMTWSASNAYDNYYLAKPFLALLQKGEVPEEEVNKKVRNILRLIFRTTMNSERPYGSFASDEHAIAARKIAQEGIVLLKNTKRLLPIDLTKVKTIAVIGENAVKKLTVGGGSSSLKVKYEISPLEGIQKRLGDQVKIVYAKGYESPAVIEQDVKGAKAPEKKEINVRALIDEAVAVSKNADLVLFVGGLNKNENQDSEGADRNEYNLPYHQDELITELAKSNPNTAVILLSGNAVAMPWEGQVSAIIEGWYSGSEAGNALASVLVGDINPSGKLPFTFPVSAKDNGAISMGDYPGDGIQQTYREDIFVGYRWADKQKKKPLFSFGHGLSYTSFAYSKAEIDKKVIHANEQCNVSVKVKNSGKLAGSEVVQLYISDLKSSLPRPIKELKGYKKIFLNPNEEKTVIFNINKELLQFYDDAKHQWIDEPGKFEVLIGSSSTDIRTKVAFELK